MNGFFYSTILAKQAGIRRKRSQIAITRVWLHNTHIKTISKNYSKVLLLLLHGPVSGVYPGFMMRSSLSIFANN